MAERPESWRFNEFRDGGVEFRRKPIVLLLRLLTGLCALGFIAFLSLPFFDDGRRPARRSICKNNLKQIGLALHNYHKNWKCFPPPYIADESGSPKHSWRVLLLPYLDYGNLYNQYRFDEPWDGPNNRQLHDKLIDVYCCPADPPQKKSARDTNYVAVIGAETIWPGSEGVKIANVTDGPANTLMVVETANSGIHWMEPRDLHVLQMAPTINSPNGQGMSSKHKGGAQGLFADGAVRFFSEKLPTETLRGLLTINGKERLSDGDF